MASSCVVMVLHLFEVRVSLNNVNILILQSMNILCALSLSFFQEFSRN